jgi:hypothetical protein
MGQIRHTRHIIQAKDSFFVKISFNYDVSAMNAPVITYFFLIPLKTGSERFRFFLKKNNEEDKKCYLKKLMHNDVTSIKKTGT